MNDEIRADANIDPLNLQFERKIELSIYMNPSVYYVSVERQGPFPFVSLGKDAGKKTQLALYRVLGAAPETFVLGYAPMVDDDPYAGGLLVVQGNGGPTAFMPAIEQRAATRFTLQRRGEEYHFQVQGKDLFLSAEAISGTPVFFLAKDRDLFHNHAWTARTTTLWNAQNMDNADLRYVIDLKNNCQPGSSFRNARLRRAGFGGASLAGAHFEGADCSDTSFFGADLSRCDFTGATLKGVTLGGATANGLIAPKASFEGASFNSLAMPAAFVGANLDDAVFDGCGLSGVNFSKARLARATLRKCSLGPTRINLADVAAANFSEAVMPGAVLDEVSAGAVKFDGATLGAARFVKAQLPGASFKKATLSNADFTDAVFGTAGQGTRTDFSEATLFGTAFNRCKLTEAVLPTPTKFVEKPEVAPSTERPRTALRGCDVPLAVLGTADWRNLDLGGATIVGAMPPSLDGFLADYCIFPDNYDLNGRTLRGARFRHAQLIGGNLGGVDARDAESAEQAPDFTGAVLIGAILNQARLPMATFDDATLHGVKMSHAKLNQASFVGARLDTALVAGEVVMADLSYCVLLDANFERAFLGKGQYTDGANLSYVTFSGSLAKISNATLDGAQFSNAYLTAVDFTGNSEKSMEYVSFVGACLANCVFKKASLQYAKLNNACLLGANFGDADLHGASMTGASIGFVELDLTANRPDGRTITIKCGATMIESKTTDRASTCPSGDPGPCSDDKWKRRGGTVTVWPMPAGLGDGEP